jgi:hypothetical protein
VTTTLLRTGGGHDFDTLATLCADDFGIVDLGRTRSSAMVRTGND